MYAGMSPILAKQIQSLIQASHGKVRLMSGFRTPAQQAQAVAVAGQRYGPDNANQWFVDPQHSNHVKGAAADLGGDLQVMSQLAPQFGLVAPMKWEPYHFEMASTPTHSSPGAYTVAPQGEPNPTMADFSQSVPHVAATFAESLMGLTSPAAMSDTQKIIQGIPLTDGGGGAASDATGGTTGGTTNAPAGKGDVSPDQLYKALTAEGLPPDVAAAFVSIAGRESGFRTGAHNDNTKTGDNSYGLFQVNLLHGGWGPFLQAHGMADPASQLQTFEGSVQAAKILYGSSGLHPWGGYKGVPWWQGTNLDVGAQASGGQVTPDQMQALGGG
jgi:hypothetical protein